MPTTLRVSEDTGDERSPKRAIPFSPRSRVDSLALEIAVALKDEARLPLYRMYCQRYEETIIRRALATAQEVPDDKIKKSRPALFIFLMKRYASEQK